MGLAAIVSLHLRPPCVTRFLARRYSRLSAAALAVLPSSVWALVTGELADRVADVIAVVVIIFVPIAAIYLFWKVHILPEQIAEKRQHPQKDAIRILCLLSLVFGGLLWPIAWIWAYSKPVVYKLAYGTDKYEEPEAPKPAEGESVATEPVTTEPAGHAEREARIAALEDRLAILRREIDRLSDQGAAPEDVALLMRDVARIEEKLTPVSKSAAPGSRRGAH